MLNHSSAKQFEETPHENKLTKNKRLKLNGSGARREETTHVNKSTKNKTLNLNGRGARREETTHVNNSTKNKTVSRNGTSKNTISNALKRRAQSVIKDRSIDAQSRALIRYGLATNDPWLPELVRRAEAGETIIYTVNYLKTPTPSEDDSSEEKIEALAEMICRAGDEPETKSGGATDAYSNE